MRNTLYYGDNFDILQKYIKDESVDLIYLDPPFNSNRGYNVLFKEESGKSSAAQIQAFDDTWHWANAVETYEYLVTQVGGRVGAMVSALHGVLVGGGALKGNQMMAYLVMMAARLVELHRALKPTGCIYLHCDPTASHYLKVVMDTVFGNDNFQNEIIWKRTTTKSDFQQGAKNWPRIHDVILHYARDAKRQAIFVQPFTGYSVEYVETKYRQKDADGRHFMLDNLTAPGAGSRGHPQYELMGVTRYWRYGKDKMEQLVAKGRIIQPSPGAVPRYKRYLDEMKGIAVGDMWSDIDAVNAMAIERLGYPTQKPVALLERIISASSNLGDVVLDPFAGCGTTVVAAQKLGRSWIGIDITHLSTGLLKNRLRKDFNLVAGKDYDVKGEPADTESARALARKDPYEFQAWALSLVPAKMIAATDGKGPKKGADGGIDGEVTFIDDASGKGKRIIVQVKSGKVGRNLIGELRGTIEREKAAMGVFVCLERPTQPMLDEAAGAGFYASPHWGQKYPRIQIITIDELMNGAQVKMPPSSITFAKARGSSATPQAQQPMLGVMDD